MPRPFPQEISNWTDRYAERHHCKHNLRSYHENLRLMLYGSERFQQPCRAFSTSSIQNPVETCQSFHAINTAEKFKSLCVKVCTFTSINFVPLVCATATYQASVPCTAISVLSPRFMATSVRMFGTKMTILVVQMMQHQRAAHGKLSDCHFTQ